MARGRALRARVQHGKIEKANHALERRADAIGDVSEQGNGDEREHRGGEHRRQNKVARLIIGRGPNVAAAPQFRPAGAGTGPALYA
jgi:hypothetical protein